MSGFLQAELLSVAICWRLERRDGVALGFTAHDRDLEIDGLRYRAAPGMLPSEIGNTDRLESGSLDVEGALTASAITARDLADGRWDNASVTVFLVDWSEPGGERLLLTRGTLGEVTVTGDRFEAELKGPLAALDRRVIEQTSPECRAQLGDRRCRVPMAGRVRVTRVEEILGEAAVRVEEAAPGNAYGYGRLRWLSGANSGLENAIVRSEDGHLTLREPPPEAIAVGDLVEIGEGCNKSFATCVERFANAENFRGEPHLPGMDLLTRYSVG